MAKKSRSTTKPGEATALPGQRPTDASFDDVPTTHWAFGHVERLKALGRTDLLKEPPPPKRHSAAIPSEELRKSELWARDEKMGGGAP